MKIDFNYVDTINNLNNKLEHLEYLVYNHLNSMNVLINKRIDDLEMHIKYLEDKLNNNI